jgi:hypothetical protein
MVVEGDEFGVFGAIWRCDECCVVRDGVSGWVVNDWE